MGSRVWENAEYSHPFYCRPPLALTIKEQGEWPSDNLVSKYPIPDKSLTIPHMKFIPKLVNQEIFWPDTFWNNLEMESNNLYILYPECYKIALKVIEVNFFLNWCFKTLKQEHPLSHGLLSYLWEGRHCFSLVLTCFALQWIVCALSTLVQTSSYGFHLKQHPWVASSAFY